MIQKNEQSMVYCLKKLDEYLDNVLLALVKAQIATVLLPVSVPLEFRVTLRLDVVYLYQ